MSTKSKFSLLLIITLLISGLLSGCIEEDLSDCPRPFQITIKALDVDMNDITESGEVKNAILFVFDETQKLVKAFELTSDQVKSRKPIDIIIDYPGSAELTFVAWGNVDNNIEYSQISSVQKLKDLYVKLTSKDGFAQPSCDFFRGNLIVPVEYGGTEKSNAQVVEIYRMTTGVTITAINLKEWNYLREGTYKFVLRASMDTYGHDGVLTGNMVSYSPGASFYQNGDFHAPIFYTFPAKNFMVDIYFNGELLCTVGKDADVNLFIPVIGRTLNIIIDFRAEISLNSIITPWNVVYQNVGI